MITIGLRKKETDVEKRHLISTSKLYTEMVSLMTNYQCEIKYVDSASVGYKTDILFSYTHENISRNIDASKKFHFLTMTTNPPYLVNPSEYTIVANSGICKDIFNDKYQNGITKSYGEDENSPFGAGEVRLVSPQSCSLILDNYPVWSWESYKRQPTKNIVWMGNVTDVKENMYIEFIDYCKTNNIKPTVLSHRKPSIDYPIDHISHITHNDLPKFLTQFEYGVGVGRSYLDMAILGLKVINAGNNKGDQTTEQNIQNKIYENFATHQYPTTKSFSELVATAVPINDLIASELSKTRFLNQVETIINT